MSDTEIPTCPSCGSPMAKKTNQSSRIEFWGCSTYPKCKATLSLTPEAEAEHQAWRDAQTQELEAQDAAGYHGGLTLPTPTKKDLAVAKGKQYDEAEQYALYKLVIECDGDLPAVVEKVGKEREQDTEYPVRLIDEARLCSFLERHMEDFVKHARTISALPTIVHLAKNASQENVRLSAAKYLWDRADGSPTAKTELEIRGLTWTELAERRNADAAQYSHGEWTNPDEMEIPTGD